MYIFTSFPAIQGTKKFLVVLFFMTLSNLSFGQQQATPSASITPVPGTVAKNGTELMQEQQNQKKQDRAKQMNTLCPHYPVSKTPGASKESHTAFENWKKSYPEEYIAYLKIYGLKQ